MTNKKKILVLGPLPPPIGGVSIHVRRLTGLLNETSLPHTFLDIKKSSGKTLLKSFFNHRLIHANTSNSKALFALSALSFLFRKKLIITYHSSFGRKGRLNNFLEKLAIYLCHKPLSLNESTLEIFKNWNSQTQIISAFLAPTEIQPLKGDSLTMLDELLEKFETVFCTNAYRKVIDVTGEVYGIIPLVEVFRGLNEKALVISDPSGEYKAHFEASSVPLPENIKIVSEQHDFVYVMKRCHGMIRATTTDGDSLSVKEGLWLSKGVITSDVVQRPQGCLLYPTGKFEELKKVILAFDPKVEYNVKVVDGGKEIIEIYNEYLSSS